MKDFPKTEDINKKEAASLSLAAPVFK